MGSTASAVVSGTGPSAPLALLSWGFLNSPAGFTVLSDPLAFAAAMRSAARHSTLRPSSPAVQSISDPCRVYAMMEYNAPR